MACFPLTHPQHQVRQVSFPLVPLMSPGLPARLHPSAPVSPLKQEQQRKNQKGIFNILLHHPQINETYTLYLFPINSSNFLGSQDFPKQLC